MLSAARMLPIGREASPVEAAGNRPFLIDDCEVVWIVETGKLDLFFVETRNGAPVGPRRHFMRAEAGQAVFGIGSDGAVYGTALLAMGAPGTQLLRVSQARLKELAFGENPDDSAVALIEDWVAAVSQALSSGIPPKDYVPLEPGSSVKVAEGKVAFNNREVVWVRHVHGSSSFMGLPAVLPVQGSRYFPLTRHSWLVAACGVELQCVSTTEFIALDAAWDGLHHFHAVALSSLALKRLETSEKEQVRLESKARSDERLMHRALARLTVPLTGRKPLALSAIDDDPLVKAAQMVGAYLDIPILSPPPAQKRIQHKDPVANIARASGIRIRRVRLMGEWWKEDHGPLLAFVEADKSPVALLPASPRKYELHDPAKTGKSAVNRRVAATLEGFAYTFYRPFPNRKLKAADLIRFGLKGLGGEITTILLAGFAAGLLGMITPIFTGVIFDSVIPGAQRGQLWQISILLLVGAITTALFQVTRAFALLRLDSRMGVALQSAVWDRLLNLPAPFFHHYSAGDLSDRANGIDAIRTSLTGTAINTILSGIFSLFNFALLFYYSWKLALVATGIVLVALGVTVFAGMMQLKHVRKLVKVAGHISGTVFQFISGIAKFRISGTEGRVLAAWADDFADQKDFSNRARNVTNGFAVFNSALMVIGPAVIFFMVFWWTGAMTAGDFLAFNSAFGQFFTSSLAVSSAIISVMSIGPIYERAKPIVESLSEVDAAKADPGELTGEIEVSHVAFRYKPDDPLVIQDVALHAEPGEFIALVGASGCGKSTLFRLLLGFETPESGGIYYDGQDLNGLDLQAVRRQMGVVLQNGMLLRGDIFTNIVGSSPLTIDDAWEAARLSGLEEDIKQLPMGMHTVISEGGGGLSGGQRQRLLIARAIVNKPRIILFDEATSALDNHTQAIVSRSLEGLQATRVVIAHRLSTIIHADKIFVLDKGFVVQSGSYDELIQQPGLFAELAKRQLV